MRIFTLAILFVANLACAQGTTTSGQIKEAIDASSYTYLRLKTSDGEVWAAVPQAKFKTGDTVVIQNSMTMRDFESKSLHRKFDSVIFGTLAEGQASGHLHQKPAAVDLKAIKVKAAPGPDGKTVSQVYAERTALNGQTVAVRGKVVKVLPGIMGKNWIHISDGTGSAKNNDFDLTVTSLTDHADVGDVVTIKGKVAIDQDLGAGYFFKVLVQEASLL